MLEAGTQTAKHLLQIGGISLDVAQDQSAGGHTLVHGSLQGMLSIFNEFVNFCQ